MDWQMAFSISYVIESVRRKFRSENSKLPYLIGSRSFIKDPFVHKYTAVEFITANTFSIAFAPILFYLGWKIDRFYKREDDLFRLNIGKFNIILLSSEKYIYVLKCYELITVQSI